MSKRTMSTSEMCVKNEQRVMRETHEALQHHAGCERRESESRTLQSGDRAKERTSGALVTIVEISGTYATVEYDELQKGMPSRTMRMPVSFFARA